LVEDELAERRAAAGGSVDFGLGAVEVAAADEPGDGEDGHREGDGMARPMGRVLAGFFLTLGLSLVALYVSLKYLDGSVYALAAGLGMGVFALTFEGLRLVKAWTV
jgi:hypothetical protein